MNSLMGKSNPVSCIKGVNLVRDSDDWYYRDRRFKEPEVSSHKVHASKFNCLKFAYRTLIWFGAFTVCPVQSPSLSLLLSLLETISPRPPTSTCSSFSIILLRKWKHFASVILHHDSFISFFSLKEQVGVFYYIPVQQNK